MKKHLILMNKGLQKKSDTRKIAELTYAEGFIKACADRAVDPRRIVEIVKVLDLHL